MSPVDDALQAALAVEHRIVFGYGSLGPRLSGGARASAHAAQAAHEVLRDRATAALIAVHLQPVVSQTDYPDLYPADQRAALRLAVALETEATRAWRFVYAQSSASGAATALRGLAQDALTASAVRATRWRMSAGARTATVAFPGI